MEAEYNASDARFAEAFEGAPVGMILTTPDGRILEANQAYLDMLGYTREELAARDSSHFTHPDDILPTRELIDALHRGSEPRAAIEKRYIRKDGKLLWARASVTLRRDRLGAPTCLIAAIEDITERKVRERHDAFLVQLDDATRPLNDPHQITQTVARMLGEHLGVHRCAYADVEEDQDAINVIGDYNRDFGSIVGRYKLSDFGADFLRAMRGGKPYVVTDSATDARMELGIATCRRIGIRSAVCVPLLKSGRLVAGVAVDSRVPRQWWPEEVDLVVQVANRAWESIERARILRAMREREQRYRFLAESIPQMVWTATPEGMLDYVNGQGCVYFGVPEEALLGAGWLAYVHPEEQDQTVEQWKESLASGRPYETSFRLRRGADQAWRWHLARALPMGDPPKIVQWFGTCTDIEDQKQAQESLRRQWQTFDTALSHTPDFTYVFNLSGCFTYVNRALLELWQKSLEEAVGKNFFDLGYPLQLAETLQRQIQEVIKTRRSVKDQTPFASLTGETREYEYIFVPVFDAKGRVEAVAGSTRDITDRNRASQGVEEDRRRWRHLLLQTPAAIAVLRGPEHRFEWINADYLRLVGRPEEALVGKTLLEALPETAEQAYLKLLDNVYQTGEPFLGHESLVRLDQGDGTLKDFYLNFVYLATRNDSGEINGIFVHATDVTAMVVARKQVEESERQFRTLAETIPHLAWMADETGAIFWYNRRWYEYTGTTFEEMKGWGWQAAHDPAALPEVLKVWRDAILTGEPFSMVFPIKGSDGEFRSFLTRIEPVKDDRGRVVRWFGTNTDITDQRRTEQELRRMNRELEEFAYVASHDLQEPLRMINIYTQLMLRAVNDTDGKLALYSGFIEQGVVRMEALIHDLLTFSKAVHAEQFPAGIADLSASLDAAISVLQGSIEESGAIITAQALPRARGDTGQMTQVFQNLLSNAIKYRKSDAVPQIEISVEADGGQWIISITDNGIGFEQQYAERIFGLFKRLHHTEYPGTGLGLAICKRIVERYGGRMWAESRAGNGATFRFALDRIDAEGVA